MREILFRGKRTDNGEWAEGYYACESNHACFAYELKYHHYIFKDVFLDWNLGGLEKYEVIPETVGQYTGLCDKNGKKIFEGDILKGKHQWRNWNTSFGNDEKDFLEQKIRGAYGKYIDKTANEFIKGQYHYFRNYAVEYYAPNGGYRVRNGGQFHRLDQSYIFNRELEIIGNIHDNPELLKGGAE